MINIEKGIHMNYSRKDFLTNLMHSAEQGKKLREGTDLANKRLSEEDLSKSHQTYAYPNFGHSQPKRGQAVVYATQNDSNPLSIYLRPFDKGGVIPMTTQLPPRDFQRGTLIAPGRNETGPRSQVGFGSQGVNRVSPDAISPEEAASADPNADLRSKIAAGDTKAAAEQKRRDENEAKMNAARNESYEDYRKNVIFETIRNIMEQGVRRDTIETDTGETIPAPDKPAGLPRFNTRGGIPQLNSDRAKAIANKAAYREATGYRFEPPTPPSAEITTTTVSQPNRPAQSSGISLGKVARELAI